MRWIKQDRKEQKPVIFNQPFIAFFSGKIDLKDVKEAAVGAFKATSKYANEVYVWAAQQIKGWSDFMSIPYFESE